jgi:hypothetical protein
MATVRPMSRPLGLAVTLSFVLLAVAACGSDGEPETASPPSTTAMSPPPVTGGGDGDEEAIRGSGGAAPAGPVAEGETVPDIVGPTLGGESISLSDFRGKRVIVHLWSSW